MKVAARFDNPQEIKQLFPQDFSVVGVGVTAYPRSALGYLLPNYQILSLLETADLQAIRKICPVVSLEKNLEAGFPEKFNTSGILTSPKVQAWLKNKQGLFVYKASSRIDQLAKELNLKLFSTPGEIRAKFENKKTFREELVKAGIEPIPGETLAVDSLDERRWESFKKQLGERLVLQLPDYTIGGGIGTFFVNKKEDFQEFWQFVSRRRQVRKELGKVIELVNVTQFIDGEACSISGCSTRLGTITGGLQQQVIDQPELAALAGRSGVWLGHDWSVSFEEKAESEARNLSQKWGDYLYQSGYKGIFGLDLVVTKDGQAWPVECNSRYTGAFPVYTMRQLAHQEVPLDVWHLLEWFGLDYEFDKTEVQRLARQPKPGAQLLLHNLERKFVTPTQAVPAGIYRILPTAIEYLRPGFSLLDLEDEQEFVLCDRVVGEEAVLKPAERLGRLVFKRSVIDKSGRLLPEIKTVVKLVYDRFALMPVENPA